MASEDRRAREKVEVQERILDAARELFVTQGLDAVSMRKIAEAIEYTPAALYVHFKDKNELMREMCRRDFEALTRETLKLAMVKCPIARIYLGGAGYIRFGIEHKNHYRMMFMTPHPPELVPTDEDRQKMNDPDQDGYAFIRHAVHQAIEQKRFRQECNDVEAVTQTFWGAVHGVTAIEITHCNDPWLALAPLTARIELILDVVLRGMLANPSELESMKARLRERGLA
ncbi:MAG: TetR/AcrR family transcriptional regulator [Phycisphaerales bacterium]|nr:TetR/AcrR family transcriptional regulator [Phycisphaerales bacterium]